MKEYTPYGAKVFTDSVWNLYSSLEDKFGSEMAWEFILTFYKGAGSE